MRHGRCPKCGGGRIATTELTLYLGAGVSGPTIELYACADCRFVEQYVKNDVVQLVSVLDAWKWVQPRSGPFRTAGSKKPSEE
ncbi:MAG: hypothetical protein IT378_19120 [Sandaracinaceae bacterium]|nr:hypothetical protein [Sandaracinaceae bacterium]MCC6876423.1 hypothetical protein [Sandaracinaceae bacterium]